MGTLHLNGTLKLSGSLRLGGKVTAEGKEVLVALAPLLDPAHSKNGLPPPTPPQTEDPVGESIWVEKSDNNSVKIGVKAVIVEAKAECIQGSAPQRTGVVIPGKSTITVDGKRVVVTGAMATILDNGIPVELTESGQ